MWTLYIVQSQNGSFYTGITKDLERRLKEHESGKRGAKYFRSSAPQKLIFQKTGLSHSQALKLEYQIKQMSRRQKELWIAAT